MTRRRLKAFQDALAAVEASGLPDWPRSSLIKQLTYLIRVTEGQGDGDRLFDINIGLLTVREVEPGDSELVALLHRAAGEATFMARRPDTR